MSAPTAPPSWRGSPPRRPPGSQPGRADFGAFLRRPVTSWARAALVTVNLAAVTFFLLSYRRSGVGIGPYHIDLDVYRIGARVWLRGGNLYDRLPVTRAGARLPFTYPPVAAILFAPLALVPYAVAATALTLATVALLGVVLRVFLRRLAGPAAGSPWALAWLLPAALFLEPVRDTLGFGQINVVLMALATLDCLTETPRWPRGALVGLAAAIKLTPAAFVLFFMLRRDYRATGLAGLSFAAATAVGWVAAWPDSVQYWTRVLPRDGSRAGNPGSASNQCIVAILARAGLNPHSAAGVAAWLALAVLVVIVASRGMRHALAASQDCLALSLNAFAALLISPVSWSHHWVWCAPALLTFAMLGFRHRSRLALVAAGTGLAVFTAAPQFWFRHGLRGQIRGPGWQQASASAYVIFAALVLLMASCAFTRRRRPGRGSLTGRESSNGACGDPPRPAELRCL